MGVPDFTGTQSPGKTESSPISLREAAHYRLRVWLDAGAGCVSSARPGLCRGTGSEISASEPVSYGDPPIHLLKRQFGFVFDVIVGVEPVNITDLIERAFQQVGLGIKWDCKPAFLTGDQAPSSGSVEAA